MKYDSKNASILIPEGVYTAELLEAEDKKSKKGNDMQVLTWLLITHEGPRRLRDYIMADSNFALNRYGKLADAFGESKAFDENRFDAANFISRTANLVVKIRPAKDGYDESNNIVDYKSGEFDPETEAKMAQAKSDTQPADSDIPF